MKIPLTQQCSPFSGHSSPVHQFPPLSNYRVLQKNVSPISRLFYKGIEICVSFIFFWCDHYRGNRFNSWYLFLMHCWILKDTLLLSSVSPLVFGHNNPNVLFERSITTTRQTPCRILGQKTFRVISLFLSLSFLLSLSLSLSEAAIDWNFLLVLMKCKME